MSSVGRKEIVGATKGRLAFVEIRRGALLLWSAIREGLGWFWGDGWFHGDSW